jgi:hypothetical protein
MSNACAQSSVTQVSSQSRTIRVPTEPGVCRSEFFEKSGIRVISTLGVSPQLRLVSGDPLHMEKSYMTDYPSDNDKESPDVQGIHDAKLMYDGPG